MAMTANAAMATATRRRRLAAAATRTALIASLCVFASTAAAAAAVHLEQQQQQGEQQEQQKQQQRQMELPLRDIVDPDSFYERRMTEEAPILLANLNNGLRYLKQIQDMVNDDGESAEDEEDERGADLRGAMSKRNYQHIWRNVQMRMPIYSQSPQMGQTKRSLRGIMARNAVPRHAVNSIYRLG